MQKRESFYVATVFLVAVFMAAGCATQDVVKKDEGLVPRAAANQVDRSKPNSIPPATQTAATPVSQTTPLSVASQQDPALKSAFRAQLQSVLERIYFDFDSANLSEPARSALTRNAALLMKEPTAKIRIEGNCDERGSAEYNLTLGDRRAKSAQQYLTTLGVKPERLSTVSYGKEKPAVQGNDETTLTKNRRDEFVVVSQ